MWCTLYLVTSMWYTQVPGWQVASHFACGAFHVNPMPKTRDYYSTLHTFESHTKLATCPLGDFPIY